jgi:putative ABC transport system permease protein
LQDVRFALRTLSRSPGLVIAAILSLAIGIGAAASAFSVIEAVRFRALPFPDGDRLVIISEVPVSPVASKVGPNGAQAPCLVACSVAYETWDAVLRKYPFRTLQSVAAHTSGAKALMLDGDAVNVIGTVASPSLFPLVDARPARGRLFTADDDRLGAENVTLLSDQLWKTRFGADERILGTAVQLSDTRYTVVGIMPPDFEFETESRFWLPDVPALDPSTRPSIRTVTVIGRLASGATIDQVRAELAPVEPLQPKGPAGAPAVRLRFAVEPLRARYTEATKGNDVAFAAIVACVLLIACANFGNLLLVRAVDQRREMAVRAALGAEPARLARLVIIQHGLLVAAGSVAGLGLAQWLLSALRSVAALNTFRPAGMDYRIDLAAVLFAVGVAAIIAIAVSVLPVRIFTANAAHTALREGGTSRDAHTGRVQRAFVAAQVGCAVLLLVAAGLELKTVRRLSDIDLGFDIGQIAVGSPSYPHTWRVKEKYVPVTHRILDAIQAMPGVSRAAIRAQLPVGSGRAPGRLTLDGQADALPQSQTPANAVSVSPGYFKTLGIPMRQGREFSSDDREETPAVAIVNEWAASHWWPGRDAIGQRIRMDTAQASGVLLTVVGVVRDNRAAPSNPLLASTGPELYVPYEQAPSAFPTFLARASGAPAPLIRPLRSLLVQEVPNRPVGTQVDADVIARQLGGIRATATQVLVFAAAGLLLALIGIYGVLSYAVSRRTRELGIRRALGASDGGIKALVLGEALRLAAIGIVLGGAAASAASRLFAQILYGTNPADPAVYGAIAVVVLGTTALAALVPATRAARVSPIMALREG